MIEGKLNARASERKYPYLAEGVGGVIVLFIDQGKGVVVARYGSYWEEGYLASDWLENSFTPLTPGQTVTLTQK